MSFVKRGLQYFIQLNKGSNADSTAPQTFDNGETGLSIDNVRSIATIQSVIGGDTAYGGGAQIQIWGMKPADMAKLSSLGFNVGRFNKNAISVFAYDEGDTAGGTEIFSGSIKSANVNYNAMPDVSLVLECYGMFAQQVQTIQPTSASGTVTVASQLQVMCNASDPPVTFVNRNVTATIANPAFSGSQEQQIRDICCAAGIPYTLQDDTLTVWPRGTNIDGVTITIGPNNGMVGYPEYAEMGMNVTMAFNPQIQLGRQVTIQQASSGNPPPIPGVPGTYFINIVAHELSSQMPGGPWFTHASVSVIDIAGRI